MILAIDPGNKESGVVIVEKKTLKPVFASKMNNDDLMNEIKNNFTLIYQLDNIAIEMIASHEMPVGVEVFETCVWIGRFIEALKRVFPKASIQYIYRKDEKMNLCKSMKANDTTIKQALVDRFTPGQKNYGKGTKKEPGWFFGFAKDIWAAYAVAVTYKDMYLNK